MPYTLVWLPAAELDLYHQLDYVETRDSRAANALAIIFLEATERLLQFPEIGRLGRKPKTRELVLTGTAFLIVNRVRSDEIVILRFLHGAQRWPKSRRSRKGG